MLLAVAFIFLRAIGHDYGDNQEAVGPDEQILSKIFGIL